MKVIPISRGLSTLVDDDDFDLIKAGGPWHACPDGHTTYARRHVHCNGRRSTQNLHTFLTGWPETDHRNGNGLDNQRANLRLATRSQNMGNGGNRANNTSGYKGAHWRADTGRWRALITVEYRRIYLGYFDSAEDAARAYDAAARDLFGEFAALNFPADGERGCRE